MEMNKIKLFSERCYLPKSVGRCRASEEKFYYDHETGVCETFLYGGCLGNGNKFDDIEECTKACVEPHRIGKRRFKLTGCRTLVTLWVLSLSNTVNSH